MINHKHPWYRSRGYSHFDSPLSQASAEQIATNPIRVARHAFFPFLRYTVETQKVEKDSITGLVAGKPPKIRPISFASHVDSHIYSYYSHLLSDHYEELLDQKGIGNAVLAFRPLGKSNIDFANEAFEHIKKLGNCVTFATDITGFFDNLDHAHLKKAWSDLLGVAHLPADHFAVFKSLTKYAYVIREELFPILGLSNNNPPSSKTRLCSPQEFRSKVRNAGLVRTHSKVKGIPQGSPISALLSNIYLMEFDELLHEEIDRRGGKYMRYCDDILCIIPTQNDDSLSDLVETLISRFHLEINEDKTDTIRFSQHDSALVAERPLQYLGFTFDGKNKLIRSAAFAKFSDKMRRGVNLARQTTKKHNKRRFKKAKIWRKKLYERYSHLGKRNFVRYGLRAAEKMNSVAIRRQLKPLWKRLNQRIDKANEET